MGMSNLLFLNMLMGIGLAYAAMREYRKNARIFRVLAAVSGLSLLVCLGQAGLLPGINGST